MRAIKSFTLEQHSGPYETWPGRTRLFVNGDDAGTKASGFIIEAQYECEQGYILITSQDCP
jgi:hypothetical protein